MELVQQQWISVFTCPGWHRLTRSGYRCAAGTRSLLAADNHRRLIEFRNRLLVCSIHPERKHFPRLLVAEATRVVAALQPGPPLRRRSRRFEIRVTRYLAEYCEPRSHHVVQESGWLESLSSSCSQQSTSLSRKQPRIRQPIQLSSKAISPPQIQGPIEPTTFCTTS